MLLSILPVLQVVANRGVDGIRARVRVGLGFESVQWALPLIVRRASYPALEGPATRASGAGSFTDAATTAFLTVRPRFGLESVREHPRLMAG